MSLQKQFIKTKNLYKVTFVLPETIVDGAKEVKVLGDFNDWDPDHGVQMKLKDGEFKASVELTPGSEYQFRYLIDNQKWANDWSADKYVPSPFGADNSVVVTDSQKN
ncbi:MAG TPA: isoamylase early set domain-containing protein [Flavilitoribacter sp.]|nr:isoamylase early set domain-containing protein [Flavilitoribacter sp.]